MAHLGACKVQNGGQITDADFLLESNIIIFLIGVIIIPVPIITVLPNEASPTVIDGTKNLWASFSLPIRTLAKIILTHKPSRKYEYHYLSQQRCDI